MYFYWDPTYILVIIGAVICAIASVNVSATFKKYAKSTNLRNMTAEEVAQRMLFSAGIRDVRIERVGGNLSDHYSPKEKVLRLSDSVYGSRSVAAIGVAAHECGHAIQHAQGYAPLALRSKLVPLVSFSSSIATWVIIGGLILMASTNNETLCWIGIGLVAMSALFSIVTLPVEYNASERALAWLESSRTLQGEELDGARIALRWAARTYLVAALSAIATVLYYITLITGRRND